MLGSSITTFGDVTFGIVAADLLDDSSLDTLSVRSGLLSGGEMKEDDCFFRILEENDANIRISSLHVDNLTETEAEAFTCLMRQSTHLHSFTVDVMDSDFYQYSIVIALHENGSLQTMSLAEDQMYPARDGPPLSKRDRHEMRTYLKRNATLPQLLRRPRLDDTDDDVTDVALFPALFSAANVASCMAPTWFLTGLLAASGTSTGPKMIRDA
jgi:hypothetical protein